MGRWLNEPVPSPDHSGTLPALPSNVPRVAGQTLGLSAKALDGSGNVPPFAGRSLNEPVVLPRRSALVPRLPGQSPDHPALCLDEREPVPFKPGQRLREPAPVPNLPPARLNPTPRRLGERALPPPLPPILPREPDVGPGAATSRAGRGTPVPCQFSTAYQGAARPASKRVGSRSRNLRRSSAAWSRSGSWKSR